MAGYRDRALKTESRYPVIGTGPLVGFTSDPFIRLSEDNVTQRAGQEQG